MTTVFAILLVVHGMIHLLGFAKAFGLAALPQLTESISPVLGVVWLIAATLFLSAATSLLVWPRFWWAVGACAIVASVVAIVPSWADAKFGLLGDGLLAVGIAFGFLARG